MHADLSDLTASEPAANLSPPLQALWWLKKGGLAVGPEWEKAHTLCQLQEGDPAYDVVHALVHWVEGDMGNAGYWYRRVKQQRAETKEAEWQRIATVVTT